MEGVYTAGRSEIRPDGGRAWIRLAILVAISSLGGAGMWSIVVTLPAVQAEFGAERGGASLPYTLTMLGVAAGGVLMGRVADRFGLRRTILIGMLALSGGYALASRSGTLWQYALLHGVLVGMLGTAALFGPLIADASRWFIRRRGLAVSICASGNYIAGAFWPPVVAYATRAFGWRAAELGIGAFCLIALLPLVLILGPGAPPLEGRAVAGAKAGTLNRLGMSPALLQFLLIIAGIACCVAMSMPQVHIVAYCGDLGYGVARGAEMLTLMLGFGIISRVASGWIADRIGGLPTLLAGSLLQGLSLLLYMGFDSLVSLYVISALFGLFQGGIIPSYAIIVREYFPVREAGTRVGIVLMATLIGMALGGWMSGAIFDLTGSYRAAFANGVAFNMLNGMIALFLLTRGRGRPAFA